jgi:methylmalonyl-CoA mutase cobalamin-binding domain/chain
VLLCFYIALADKRGIPRDKIGGTVQNDCLKEFIAQHAWLVPPRPAMRIVTDMIEFCSTEVPRWNTVSISGYHIREAGATAAQELAFTLADGSATWRAASRAGSTSTTSRRGCRSSSTSTTTSSRRSPSSARRAACGRAS